MNFAIALLLKPLALFLVLLLTGFCVRYPVQRFMKEGKLKRLLLSDVSGDANARRWRQFRARSKQKISQ